MLEWLAEVERIAAAAPLCCEDVTPQPAVGETRLRRCLVAVEIVVIRSRRQCHR